MSPAWIDLDGPVNVRDLGGTPVGTGGQVQPGRLIRADHLRTLSDADITELVERRGVRDIVDLRSEVELQITGPGPLTQVSSLTHHHHSLFREREATVRDALVLPWQEKDTRDDAAPGGARPRGVDHWTEHYLGYLSSRPDSISSALRVISQSQGATVVHCAAGKDRTGTVVALALSVAGVAQDDIAADYAASGERVEQIVARLSELPSYADNLRGRPMSDHTPDAQTIPRLFEAIEGAFGSVPDFLGTQGWSDDDLQRLADRLTRP